MVLFRVKPSTSRLPRDSSRMSRGAEEFQLSTTMWSVSSTCVIWLVTFATCCSIVWLTVRRQGMKGGSRRVVSFASAGPVVRGESGRVAGTALTDADQDGHKQEPNHCQHEPHQPRRLRLLLRHRAAVQHKQLRAPQRLW